MANGSVNKGTRIWVRNCLSWKWRTWGFFVLGDFSRAQRFFARKPFIRQDVFHDDFFVFNAPLLSHYPPSLNNDPLPAQSISLPRLSRRGTGPDVPVSATKDGLQAQELSTRKSR